jgi:hypothetical protein
MKQLQEYAEAGRLQRGLSKSGSMSGVLALALLLPAWVEAGQYHVCTDGHGNKLFTESPCPVDSTTETREFKAGLIQNVEQQPNRLSEDNPAYQTLRDGNRKLELERKIKDAERKLEASSKAMQDEVNPMIKDRNALAGNNKENRKKAMDIEIQAVKDRYFAEMTSTRDALDAMRAELATLTAKGL